LLHHTYILYRLTQGLADMSLHPSATVTAADSADAKTGRTTATAVFNSSNHTSSKSAILQQAMATIAT
jgi:hypothetical protein